MYIILIAMGSSDRLTILSEIFNKRASVIECRFISTHITRVDNVSAPRSITWVLLCVTRCVVLTELPVLLLRQLLSYLSASQLHRLDDVFQAAGELLLRSSCVVNHLSSDTFLVRTWLNL